MYIFMPEVAKIRPAKIGDNYFNELLNNRY